VKELQFEAHAKHMWSLAVILDLIDRDFFCCPSMMSIQTKSNN
jgi:hypothetical protein